jgi:pyruvate,water dikinase
LRRQNLSDRLLAVCAAPLATPVIGDLLGRARRRRHTQTGGFDMKGKVHEKRNAQVPHVVTLENVGREDVPRVGGKNASLGELIRRLESGGIRVPRGFAVTADAYWAYIRENDLKDRIAAAISDFEAGAASLEETGKRIRSVILKGNWQERTRADITRAYEDLCRSAERPDVDVAVRSSATAEDLPEASFAGQQETFLNIRGAQALLDACRKCYASLFTDRAIAYRKEKGFDHLKIALSVGVQRMVRSDQGGSGVMFSIDTETGFDRVVVVNAAWGLGENIVQGTVDPDEYIVFKPLLEDRALAPIIGKTLGSKAKKMIYASSGAGETRNVPTSSRERASFVLSDEEILELARWACAIEKHYGMPMDMEWAKDGPTGAMFIVQARPETVQALKKTPTVDAYRMQRKGPKFPRGLSILDSIVSGRAQLIRTPA